METQRARAAARTQRKRLQVHLKVKTCVRADQYLLGHDSFPELEY